MPFKKVVSNKKLVEFDQKETEIVNTVLNIIKSSGKTEFQQAADQKVSWVDDTDSMNPYVFWAPVDKDKIQVLTDGNVTTFGTTRTTDSGILTNYSIKDYNYIVIRRKMQDSHSGRPISYCSLVLKSYRIKAYIQKHLNLPVT